MLLAPPPDPTQTQKVHSACDGNFNLPPTKSTFLNSRGHRIRHSYSLRRDVRYRNSQSHTQHTHHHHSQAPGCVFFACQLSSLLHHVSRIGGEGKEDRRIGGEKEVKSLAPIWFSNLACALLFNGRDWGRLSGESRYGCLFPSSYLFVQLYDGIHMMDAWTAC